MLGTLGFGFAVVFIALAPLALGILDFESSKAFRSLNTECSGHQGCTPDRPKSMFPILFLILPAAAEIQPGPLL